MGGEQLLIEERPEMLTILRFLIDHGARGETGYRERQQTMADELGLDVRRMRGYLRALEKHRLLIVRRTTTDGGFGSPRGFNIYKLRCTVEQYEQLAPQLVELRKDRVAKVRSAKARNRENERRRRSGQTRVGPPVIPLPVEAAPGVLGDAEVAVLAAEYAGDEDLDGW